MEAAQTMAPSFESVWAGLQEVKEMQKENARQMKEYNLRMSHYDNLFGEISEYMIAPKLRDKFRELGFNFPSANRNTVVDDYENDIHLEIDVKLENGDKVMLVEIKTKMTEERVRKHIERLEKMRRYADLHGDKRSFLGAVAGIAVDDEVKNYALEQGFFVVEPSGDNFNITMPEGKPKEWQTLR